MPKLLGGGGGGLKCILLAPFFILYSAVVKTQKLLSSHGGFLIKAKYHRRETIFQVLTELGTSNNLKNGSFGNICILGIFREFFFCRKIYTRIPSVSTLFVKKVTKHFSRRQKQTTFVVIRALMVKVNSVDV